MPKSRHGGRHAQRPGWRNRLKQAPTTLAVAGIAALFIVSGGLAIRIMTVPAKLRTEASAPSGTHDAVRQTAAASSKAPTNRSDRRANRSDQRSPSATTKATTAHHAAGDPAATPVTYSSPSPTSSPRPRPRPSPSPSSSGPVPLPTLSP